MTKLNLENNEKSCRNNKVAFTLAEVLITLGIIGVVAAMTLPTLIANYQKRQTVVQLKKVYSVLNQALQKSIAENGTNLAVEYVPADPNVGGSAYGAGDPGAKYLIPHLEVADKFLKANNKIKYSIKIANGTAESQFSWTLANISPYRYVLKDGTIITFVNFLEYSPMNNSLFILADLNGFKGPNRIGRDVFVFTLSKAKPQMIGTMGDKYSVEQLLSKGEACPAKDVVSGYQGYAGWGCSSIIMKDGWKIEKHYPWW